jgi:hypothetical protein
LLSAVVSSFILQGGCIMNEKKSRFGVPMTADQYAEQWEINSKSFFQDGHYSWMAQQLGGGKIVVEIGSGSGNGTLALVNVGNSVLVVEPNEMLAQMTFNLLKDNGVGVSMVCAGSLDASSFKDSCQVLIAPLDVFSSQVDDLLSSLSFDAIVCWLIGAEPDRISEYVGVDKYDFVGPEARDYREKVHSRCYELGRKHLPSGGVVQIVDRIGLDSWSNKGGYREALAERHQELSVESYEVVPANTFF